MPRYKSLDEFIPLAMAFFANLPDTPFANTLPQKYLTGWRSYDMFKIMQWADFQPTDIVLDTGSWLTFTALFVRQFVATVHATDNYRWEKRDFAKSAQYTADKWEQTIMSLGDVHAFPMDVQNTRQPNNSYDKILSISTIEHVIDDVQAMAEMYRILKPGGRLLLTSEYHETQGKPYDEADGSFYRVYNRETWDALLAPYNVIAQEVSTLPHDHYFTVIFSCVEKPL